MDNDGDIDAWLGYGPLPQFEDANDEADITEDRAEQPDAFMLNEDGIFSYKTGSWGLEDGNITRSGIFCDFNRDGSLDLLRSSMLGPIFLGETSNW